LMPRHYTVVWMRENENCVEFVGCCFAPPTMPGNPFAAAGKRCLRRRASSAR
jgi:hypothetical protein